MIAERKNLSVEQGGEALFDGIRYFVYIANDTRMTARQAVRFVNGRRDRENGIDALRMPSGTLHSNGACMVMAAPAWNMKA